MNISFSETFKKVTSVALIFGIVFSTLTPAAFADTSGPSTAGTASNISGVGTKTWGTPENITTDGSPYTNTTLNIGETSNYLQGTNYGFNIPSGATINGITVQINRQGSANTLGLGVRDNIVRLVKGGTIIGNNKAVTGSTWGTTFTTVTYGGSSDLWGTTWTPAEINAANFGAALSITTNAILSRTATVNYIKIIVDYTPDNTAPVISQVTAVPSPTADTTPSYTFTTDEAGTITYGGDCSSATTSAVAGPNTITFNSLAGGTHSNCTIRVTDAATNASNILSVNSFTVDTAAPLLSLPSNITQEATSSSGATVTFSATSTDVDPVSPVVTCNPASGATFSIATTTVNCSATDTVGNVANGSFTVTVQDTTKPVITLNGGTVNLNVGDAYTEQGATATDIVDGDLTASIITAGSVNTAAPGAYTITYNVTDSHGNTATTVSRTVNVSDVTAPVISGVPSDIVVEQVGNAAATVSYTNPTANDDVDGSVAVLCSPTSGSSFSYGLTAVLCNATDLASNVANASFNVTVQDTIAPTATSVVIVSDNANTSLAKEGNIITVSFTTSEPVNTPTATIAGKTATVTNTSGNNYTATYTLTTAETQGVASLAIDFTDVAGNTATQVTATTDSSSVTIDTIKPVLSNIIPNTSNPLVAEFNFTTNENSTAIINYGPSTAYGSTVFISNSYTLNHNITITGLNQCEKYNYSLTITDESGNVYISPDAIFQVNCNVLGGGGGGINAAPFTNSQTVPVTNSSTTPTPQIPNNPTLTQSQNASPNTPTNLPSTPEPTLIIPTEYTTSENPGTPADNNNIPTPTPNPTESILTPEPTPTTPATGGNPGGTPTPSFNPADATLDVGGAGDPEQESTVDETEPVSATTDIGGGVAVEETSYTLLWTLLGLIALLNTWWFFVTKNKTPTVHRRD